MRQGNGTYDNGTHYVVLQLPPAPHWRDVANEAREIAIGVVGFALIMGIAAMVWVML